MLKNLLSLFLCICFVVLSISTNISVGAIPLSSGMGALNNTMLDGECPNGLDYVYYAPETVGTTKYPLMVWLHGAKSGEYPRAQLEWYAFSNWASDEYQARFCNAGGAFILLPRASNNYSHNWNSTNCSTLKKTIDFFIEQYSGQIDTSRIYIGGYSTGGSMVWHMAVAYPKFFAAALPCCSLYNPTSVEMSKLNDMSIWIFACDQDPYPTATSFNARTNFKYLAEYSNRKDGVRLTTFTEAVWPHGGKQNADDAEHYIWGALTNDMFMNSGEQYAYSTTKDATDATISFTHPNGVINWLSQQSRPQEIIQKNTLERIAEFFRGLIRYIEALFRI